MNWSNMLSLTVWKFTDDNVAKLKLGLKDYRDHDFPNTEFSYFLIIDTRQ